MSRRVSIVLDDDLVKKLKIIQSKRLIKSNESISFSRVINDELRKAVK
jgi:predicted transcriptional regulator